MILSTKGRYGLKAMFELGLQYGKGPIPLKVIAERQNIPENYLEQLIAILRKAGLVKSVRGAQGGYLMLRPPDGSHRGPGAFSPGRAHGTRRMCGRPGIAKVQIGTRLRHPGRVGENQSQYPQCHRHHDSSAHDRRADVHYREGVIT